MDKTVVSNENENENTFWNYFLIIVLVVIIWFVFFKNKECFVGILGSSNPMPKLSNVQKNSDQENKDQTMKIIQKINKIDKAMDDNNQYAMGPLNLSNIQNQNPDQDQTYPNLSSTRQFSSRDQKVHFDDSVSNTNTNTNTNSNTNKTADGSTGLMNQIGWMDSKPVSCNMLGVDSANMDTYKKKFYSMYAHQIECPSKCKLSATGMSKGCGMGSKCALSSGCSNVNTDNTIPDTFALNYLALDNANKKSCVTCNFKPTSNPLNREWMEKEYPSYDGLPEDVKQADQARLKKMGQIDANVSNYVNFENNVNQDSNSGESAADKINEIRTCQDANGTCSLKDYGTSIANAYDKLTGNLAYTSRNSCNPYQLTGILEDSASTDMYASIH
jgi:hypothetical protein